MQRLAPWLPRSRRPFDPRSHLPESSGSGSTTETSCWSLPAHRRLIPAASRPIWPASSAGGSACPSSSSSSTPQASWATACKTGAWDVAFLGAEPQRAAEIAFTAAYLEIPSTYLVSRRVADPLRRRGRPRGRADRRGRPERRMALSGPYDQAREAGDDAGPRSPRSTCSCPRARGPGRPQAEAPDRRPETPGRPDPRRAVHGGPAGDRHPKNREASARFLRAFVEDVKASGLVAAGDSEPSPGGHPSLRPLRPSSTRPSARASEKSVAVSSDRMSPYVLTAFALALTLLLSGCQDKAAVGAEEQRPSPPGHRRVRSR